MHTFPKVCVVALGTLAILGQAQSSTAQQVIAARNVAPSTSVGGAYATGDVNRDGKLDIISYDQTKGSYVALLGNGAGSFTEKATTTVIPQQASIRLADVNGDGFLDLVGVIPGPVDGDGNAAGYGTVTVYEGDGTGDFHQTWSANIGADVAELAIADVNGDGHLDIVTSTDLTFQGTGLVQVFLNQGNGSFKQQGGASYFSLLAAGDLNGDGKADLVVPSTSSNGIQILLSNGDGTFKAGAIYQVSFNTLSPVVIDDFNKDGHQDLAVVNGFFGMASILLGKGDGTFTLKSQFNVGFPGYPGVSDIAIAEAAVATDLNRDGNPDLVIFSHTNFLSPSGQVPPSTALSGVVSVIPGNGDGTFKSATFYSTSASNAGAAQLSTGDFNGDGNQDVVVGGFNTSATSSTGVVDLLLGSKTGALEAPVNTFSADPFSIAHADFNHDGIQDIALVNQGCPGCTTTVTVFLGTGKGYFGAPKTYPIGQNHGSIAVGDINNDGKIDIVVTRGSQASITANAATTETTSNDDLSVLLGNGDGTFKPAVNSFLLGPQNGFSNTAWLVDMNRDGKLDLVGDWGVALGKGDGTFESPKAFGSTLNEIDGVGVGDMNGDGIQDIVLWQTSGYIQTLLGDGTGGFAVRATNFWANTTITDLKVGKIYGGSERDLVFSGSTANGPVVIAAKGNGNGELGTLGIIPLPNLPLSINFADFDRDGKLDVVVNDRLGVQYLRGKGNGAFYAPQFFPGATMYLEPLDVNGDGALDVVGITPIGFERLLNTAKVN